ncbi:MAG: hypothetical protein J5789_07740 [Oscillospiraceae bacterium]|nr:hypothetical protein [Oscillospiraceae bacterium]
MKKRLLLLLLFVVLFAGCQSLYPDDYHSVNVHNAPYAYRETETAPSAAEPKVPAAPPTVSRASDIRDAIKEMVLRGEDDGIFLLEDYVGDVEEDIKGMTDLLLKDSPMYIFAMKENPILILNETKTEVRVRLKRRMEPDEVKAITTCMYHDALDKIEEALLEQVASYTIQVSGFQEEDIAAELDRFILKHPDQIVEAPRISISVFPDRGNVRVLDVRFYYNTADRKTLSQRKEDTKKPLTVYETLLAHEQRTPEVVETLYKLLVPLPRNYRYDPEATVYSLVVRRVGNSRTMASVVAYLCTCAGAECEIVEGERAGEPWYWNRIMVDGRWRSFDLHATALARMETPNLLPAEEMVGYSWDRWRYPDLDEPEPSEPTDTEEPTDLTEPTDSSDPNEATEPSQPSEPAESTEPSEPVESSEPSQITEPTEPSGEEP